MSDLGSDTAVQFYHPLAMKRAESGSAEAKHQMVCGTVPENLIHGELRWNG